MAKGVNTTTHIPGRPVTLNAQCTGAKLDQVSFSFQLNPFCFYDYLSKIYGLLVGRTMEVPYSTILLLDILSFGMAKATQEMHGYHINEDDFFLTPDFVAIWVRMTLSAK